MTYHPTTNKIYSNLASISLKFVHFNILDIFFLTQFPLLFERMLWARATVRLISATKTITHCSLMDRIVHILMHLSACQTVRELQWQFGPLMTAQIPPDGPWARVSIKTLAFVVAQVNYRPDQISKMYLNFICPQINFTWITTRGHRKSIKI